MVKLKYKNVLRAVLVLSCTLLVSWGILASVRLQSLYDALRVYDRTHHTETEEIITQLRAMETRLVGLMAYVDTNTTPISDIKDSVMTRDETIGLIQKELHGMFVTQSDHRGRYARAEDSIIRLLSEAVGRDVSEEMRPQTP
jgi:hypothetical protein